MNKGWIKLSRIAIMRSGLSDFAQDLFWKYWTEESFKDEFVHNILSVTGLEESQS